MSPLTLTDPKTITPTFYRMITRTHMCKTCQHISTYSEVYAMVAVAGGFSGVPLRSMMDVQYCLPIKRESPPTTTSPFCDRCYRPDMLNGLPEADRRRQRAYAPSVAPSWAGKPQVKPKPKSDPKPRTYTIDDLEID